VVQTSAGKPVSRTYKCFDDVFAEYASQGQVYNVVGLPMAEEVLKGFNCCIFAYGQSGSGKTFTMEGRDYDGPALGDDAGLIPRAVRHICDELSAHCREDNYAVKVRTCSVILS
jgi:kinesin family member 11